MLRGLLGWRRWPQRWGSGAATTPRAAAAAARKRKEVRPRAAARPPEGRPKGGAAAGGAPEGGAAEGGATQGGGGQGGAAAGHCAGAVHCNSVDGYFCDEITGPSKAFEEACAAESGTFGAGPCDDENFGSACLFDCVTPSEYSLIGIDQVACEEAGGTYVQSL
jgi:hypothetical protein